MYSRLIIENQITKVKTQIKVQRRRLFFKWRTKFNWFIQTKRVKMQISGSVDYYELVKWSFTMLWHVKLVCQTNSCFKFWNTFWNSNNGTQEYNSAWFKKDTHLQRDQAFFNVDMALSNSICSCSFRLMNLIGIFYIVFIL